MSRTPTTGTIDVDAETAAFLDGPWVASLATVGRDGAPAQTGVWYLREGTTFWIVMARSSVKFRHIGRDPRVSLAICGHDVPYRQVLVEGRAEVQPGGGANLFRRLSVRYYGERAGHEYAGHDEHVAGNDRVAVAVRVSRFRSWNFAVEDEHHRPWAAGAPTTVDPAPAARHQDGR